MCATTLKVDDNLLDDIAQIKPKSMSVTAFMKDLVQRELRRVKLGEAARRYQEFLSQNTEEQDFLEEWDAADLSTPIKSSKRKK